MSNHKYRFSLVACARWEADYISEWLLYHRSIGFDHVYLYCNDDDPCALYNKTECFNCSKFPFVTFIHYPWLGQQYYMYLDALRKVNTEDEWLMFLDVDEFLVLKESFNIHSFIKNFGLHFDSISFNWLPFGSNGFKTRPAGSVLKNYTRRESHLHPNTKHLTKRTSINVEAFAVRQKTPFWHYWNGLLLPGSKTINVLGHDMTTYYKDFPGGAKHYLSDTKIEEKIMSIAFINHYYLKSEADPDHRLARGLSGEFKSQYIWRALKHEDRWTEFLQRGNAVPDFTLSDYWIKFLRRHDNAAELQHSPTNTPNLMC